MVFCLWQYVRYPCSVGAKDSLIHSATNNHPSAFFLTALNLWFRVQQPCAAVPVEKHPVPLPIDVADYTLTNVLVIDYSPMRPIVLIEM